MARAWSVRLAGRGGSRVFLVRLAGRLVGVAVVLAALAGWAPGVLRVGVGVAGWGRRVVPVGAGIGWARAARPLLHARAAAILVERDLGVTILAHRPHAELPIASTTKLMTAYVALHRARLDRLLTVQPYSPVAGETLAGLRPGERLSVADLLTAMLLPSGGDAAHTLAVDLAGTAGRFVGWMNDAAAGLRLGDTRFSTAAGIDTPGNHSSPSDLATLAGRLLANQFFARTVARRRAVLADGRSVVNANDLLGRHPFVIGVKTGMSPGAGFCLVGAGRRRGATVVSVVLGEPSNAARDADTLGLLRYGLSLYHRVQAVRRGRVYASVPVDRRAGERLPLVARRSVRLVLRRGARLTLRPSHLAAFARGPLRKSTRLGQLVVELDGRVLARVALVSRSPLAAAAATGRTRRRAGVMPRRWV